jgi:2-polyprenyl-3-methyl-5-hydroxy-6-metoxy-1,4-benzoquinol methylase
MNLELSGENCPLCRGDLLVQRKVFAFDTDKPDEMTVMECGRCEFAWQWPLTRSTDESVEFFEKNYSLTEEDSYFDKSKKREVCAMEIEFLNSLVPARGRLLDTGSGNGTFAEVAFEDGWTSYGLDPAGPEIEEHADGRQLRLQKGVHSDLDVDEQFDVITMWDVVEHLERPLDVIDECKSRLTPGGWLVLETGNFQSTGRILGGQNWWCFQSDHRWYFTPRSLEEILKRSGFSNFHLCKQTLRPWVKKEEVYHGPSVWSYLVKTLKRPWKLPNNVNEFRLLAGLARAYPETANIQIFTLAAQLQA